MKPMKSNTVRIIALLLALLTLFTLAVSCNTGDGTESSAGPAQSTESPDQGTTAAPSGDGTTEPALPALWENATYKEDKSFGEGAKTFTLKVVADGHTVTFTVSTDEEFVGAALLAHGIVAGENGPYGLYITSVNGITAVYETDQAYWAISKGGEYLMTGADTTPVENGAQYELTYTKG